MWPFHCCVTPHGLGLKTWKSTTIHIGQNTFTLVCDILYSPLYLSGNEQPTHKQRRSTTTNRIPNRCKHHYHDTWPFHCSVTPHRLGLKTWKSTTIHIGQNTFTLSRWTFVTVDCTSVEMNNQHTNNDGVRPHTMYQTAANTTTTTRDPFIAPSPHRLGLNTVQKAIYWHQFLWASMCSTFSLLVIEWKLGAHTTSDVQTSKLRQCYTILACCRYHWCEYCRFVIFQLFFLKYLMKA